MSQGASPLVSVCIANYNGQALLRDCIESVLAQALDGDVEIIVHDDASPDASVQFLQSHYPGVRVIASTDNVGFCVANNRMADVAIGQYLLLLNNDAALDDGALGALLSQARREGGHGILTLPQYDWESGALVDRGCLLDPFYNPVPNLDAARGDVAYVIGACLWIPRDLWQSLGGFPAWMDSIGEDLYLCCLARLRRVPVRVVGESGYHHRQGASFGGNRVNAGRLQSTYRRRRLSERNKTLVMLVCTPGWIMWPLFAVHLFLLYSEGAIVALLRRDPRLWLEVYSPILPGIVDTRAAWSARRREIQSQRSATPRSWWRCFTWMPRKLSLLWRHGMPEIR
ncbi:glycosyltransferase family 2 protein [Cognatiluteimonas telluris]|uniref:glycosyltransferase family 2 protein n=1 Tax=Cognatiluteimonas telluris TaxID=1104775 RepID=UPI0014083322|nr:glycosyltransferase [Lysobacter telluris]